VLFATVFIQHSVKKGTDAMITRRFTVFVLQLALALAGQQLLLVAPTNAQDQQPAPAMDGAAAPGAEMGAPASGEGAVAPEGSMDAAAPATEPEALQDVASAAAKSTEEHSPYGLGALWNEGDFVSKGTLIILLIMSAMTWYILVTKLWEQQRLFSSSKQTGKFWSSNSLEEGVPKLSKNSPYRNLVEDGLNAMRHHDGRLTDKIDLREWVSMTLQRDLEEVVSRLQGGMSFLATTGSAAPFIGLFGTVWGIYHALVAIGVAGQASIDKVAGPVGEALIMTAFGLVVAVPAVLAYNWLLSRNKLVIEEMRIFTSDVHAYLMTGARIADQAQNGAAARPVVAATPRSK
jgi:biopolymer transport protein ExbB